MDPAEREEPNSAEHVASDGDVVLLVGEQKIRLRVYSQCLRSASKVFNAMFGRHWSEGQGISSQSPRDVPLVEDDAHAMRLICSVIHHRNADIPDTLTAKEVLQIAVEADKYDLSVALKYARAQWLKPKGDEDMMDMAYLMVAAFLFCDMGAFVARSLDLIINYKETYLGLLDDEIISQMIPLKTFYLLAERRTRMRAEISQLLFKWADTGCSCGWSKNRGEKYALLQSEYQPLKIIEVPMFEIIDNMKAISTEDMERKYHSDRQRGGYYHETPPYEETLLGRLESMKRKAGICLDCIRTDTAMESCRFQHE